ncbi:MAG: TlpA family protein disulfide reductase [Myxococcaceae bacterium]
MPELEKLAKRYEGRVGFLAVSIAPDRTRIRVAAERMGLRTMPVAAAESEMLAPLELETVPATFLVSADGTMVERYQGLVSNDQVARRLDALLARP